MVQRFSSGNFLRSTLVAGVSILIRNGDQLFIDLIIVKKHKASIDFTTRITGLDSIEKALEYIPKSIPICLNIEGSGVLHKTAVIDGDVDSETLVKQVLSNATGNQFVAHKYQIRGNDYHVSIIRKNTLDDITNAFAEKGRFIVHISLGPFVLGNIFPLFNELPNKILTSIHELHIENAILVDFKLVSEPIADASYCVGDEDVGTSYLLAFASACTYLLQKEVPCLDNEELTGRKQEFYYRNLFMLSGKVAMVFFFLLLMINFFFFNQYSDKSNSLSAQVQQYKGLLTQLDGLSKELAMKKEFVTSSGFLDTRFLSWFADDIASTVPSEIVLTEMNLQPMKEKIKDKLQPMVNEDIIWIKGLARESSALNQWIKELKGKDWISTIVIVDYNRENVNAPGEFEFEIAVKKNFQPTD